MPVSRGFRGSDEENSSEGCQHSWITAIMKDEVFIGLEAQYIR